MGFTDKLTDTVNSISSAAAYADDGDTTTDAASASAANSNAANGTDDSSSSTAAPPDDGVDSDSAGDDLQTSDTTLGKATKALTDGTKALAEGTKKAWELTADAQRRANGEAGKSWGQKAAERNGLWNPQLEGAEHTEEGSAWEKFREAREVVDEVAEGVHVAHGVDLAQATVRAVKTIGNYPGKEVMEAALESKSLGIVGKAGGAFEFLGKAANWATVGSGLSKIGEDLADGKLSIDSLDPAADVAVAGASLAWGANPLVHAFSFGYTIGGLIEDHWHVGSKIGEGIAEGEIARTTQIGFLTDRAKENDLGVSYRTKTGTWTDRDLYRSRSIVREAREHGILDEDGNVDRYRLGYLMPNGGDSSAVDRIAGGIERAVELQKTAHDRYY